MELVGERWASERPHGLALLLHGGGQTRHSWSGTAATLAGEGWTTLVLVDVVPRVEPAGVERIYRFMTQHLDGFASLEEVADAIQANNPSRPRSARLAGLTKNVRQRADGRWYWHWDPALLQSRPAEPARAVDTERLLAAASQVHVPTLVIRGGCSDVVSVDGVDELLERLSNGSYVDVGSAGHMVAGDENDAFNEAVIEFIERVA